MRREPARDVVQIHARDRLRDDDRLGVGTREERELAALLSAPATAAAPTGRAVGGDDPPSVDDPAELVPEPRRRFPCEQRMSAAERLEVGAVGERDLDLDEDVARPCLGPRHLLDAKVARRVQERRPHGTNATLRTSPRRYSSSPSSNRSSGSRVTGGRSSAGSTSSAARKYAGVADRDPTTDSSFR